MGGRTGWRLRSLVDCRRVVAERLYSPTPWTRGLQLAGKVSQDALHGHFLAYCNTCGNNIRPLVKPSMIPQYRRDTLHMDDPSEQSSVL